MWRWLTTLKVFAVLERDCEGSYKLLGTNFTLKGAKNRAELESTKRWQKVDSEADKWLVEWIIKEQWIGL